MERQISDFSSLLEIEMMKIMRSERIEAVIGELVNNYLHDNYSSNEINDLGRSSFEKEVISRINNLEVRMSNLEQDVSVLKQDVAVLKQDVAVLKQDVSVLKQDVSVLKQDVSVLKQDVVVLKQDVAIIKDNGEKMSDILRQIYEHIVLKKK